MLGPAAGSVSRRLLGRLRDVMAGGGSAQERLDKVVRLIAMDMVAEVCSCYVLRAGEVLELFATEGLLQSAVHHTRLRVGEGVVGDIAAHPRPLALSDAQSHPSFAYRPETGEEVYHSLVGVPILRQGRVIGVLVVQNRSQRHYTEEEIETLETVAMVLAELVSSGELFNRAELMRVEGNAVLPVRMEGMRLTSGIGIGVAVMHEQRIELTRLVSEDPEAEMARLREGLVVMRRQLDDMFDAQDLAFGGAHRDVLETYRMFAEDAGWVARIGEAIRSGLTAEAAVQKVAEDTRARMAQVSDAYLRERLQDLEDLAKRLLRHLVVDPATGNGHAELPENAILVARNLGPTELLEYDRRYLRGLVLEEGSPTTHLTILAHALDIPMVGQIHEALARIDPGELLIVDGEHGQVFLRPPEDIQEAFSANLLARAGRLAAYAAMRDRPAVTLCGQRVGLMVNAALLIDLPQIEATGADGIGLYRTEVPFMVRSEMPDLATQTQLYSRILDAANGKPVQFRTLDVGSDKLLPYWNSPGEDNPAMGWRSIRITLDHPALLRLQLRALIAAASGRDLHVMFPMVAEVAELDRARAILDLELERHAARGGEPPRKVAVGTMLEVPALAWQIQTLIRRVDFVSIGTNDLTQFMFAIDRGNPRIAHRYDTLSPAMLNMLREVARACEAGGVTLSVCGDMAGRPLEAMTLIGLGVRSLSMPGPAIGPVKAMLRSLHLPSLENYLNELIGHPDHSLRERLRAFAQDHGVALGN